MGTAISSLVFQPPQPSYFVSRRYFWLTTARDERIPAFYIDRKASVTLLFCHGNAEDLGMIYDWFDELSYFVKVNVLAFDYTGYGQSSGAPSEAACYADVEAAFAHLREERGVPAERVVLYGRSLGSGPACYLAQKQSLAGEPVLGVVLQSPLLSAFRVAFHFRFTMPGDSFPNVDRVGDITCPVLIVHGTRDEVVPFWHGQELFLECQPAVRAKPFWVDGAGHNNIESLLRDHGVFYDRLNDFLDVTCARSTWGADAAASGAGVAGVLAEEEEAERQEAAAALMRRLSST